MWFAASEVRHVVRSGPANHPTRLSALIHNPLVTRDVYGGTRLAMVTIAAIAAWSGTWFLAGALLVRYPPNDPSDPLVPEQPVPAWLWQTGLILLGLGVA